MRRSRPGFGPDPHAESPDGTDPDNRPVIWTVSVSRLTGLLADVIPEFDRRAAITPINLGFAAAVDVIRRRLRQARCDVLIAGGSNAAYLRGRLDVPLAPINATGFDLMEALARARGIAPRIGVVTHADDVPDFDGFRTSFDLDIEHRRFTTAEEARDRVAGLVAGGTQVIVGTGMAIDFAERAGIPGVLLYSADSVRRAFEHAIELAQTAYRSAAGSGAPRRVARRSAPARDFELLGDSPAMARARALIALYAPHEATVLVGGDTGTGKELVARNLHLASHRRGRFVALNCGAVTESLLEAELFGYSDGAFTGARRGGRAGLVEAADGGTLFLDEIGELPLPLQTRLLRVLEEREVQRVGSTVPVPVDIRVVAASVRDLDAMVERGEFRRDLYYRLSALRIHLPSLTERSEDIGPLTDHFFRVLADMGSPLDADARALLHRYAWPGNVRELRNLIDRIRIHWTGKAAAMAQTAKQTSPPKPLTASQLLQWAPELADDMGKYPGPPRRKTGIGNPDAYRPGPAELLRILHQAGNRREAASRLLGVSRTTLWRWLREAQGETAGVRRRQPE